MEYVEQKDNTVWVRWGKYEEEDDKERVHLVKNNDRLCGKIIDMIDGKTYPEQKIITMEIIDDDGDETGKQVKFSTKSRLKTELGLNPKIPRQYKAGIGSTVCITYRGRSKDIEGNPHIFEVQFAK